MSLVSVYLNLKFNLEIVTENLHKNQSWHRNPRRNHLQTNYSRNSHESLCRANKCFYRFFIVSTTQPLCKTIKAFSHPSAAPSALLCCDVCIKWQRNWWLSCFNEHFMPHDCRRKDVRIDKFELRGESDAWLSFVSDVLFLFNFD